MNNILISVIVPVYNVENYIEEAILSICNQTHKKLQIIVVDDCSTDRTYRVIEELAKNDSRILLLRNAVNSKIVKTLNFGLKYAKGDYIARMDGDDISGPQRLEKQLNFLIKNEKIQLVGSHVITIDENGNEIGRQKMPISQSIIKKTLRYVSPVSHIWLARKSVYNILDGYREIPGAEDYDFLLRMCSSGLLFTNLDSYEYCVRVRNGNTTSTIGFNQRLMSRYVVELYFMRENNQIDSYSLENVEKYLDQHQKYKDKFDKSNLYFKTAFDAKAQKKFLKMMVFIFLAIMKSKFQFEYIFKRFLFKILSKG